MCVFLLDSTSVPRSDKIPSIALRGRSCLRLWTQIRGHAYCPPVPKENLPVTAACRGLQSNPPGQTLPSLLVRDAVCHVINMTWDTGIRGLMRGMTTLPQGNQEPLVVRGKVGRPQVSLG